MNQSNIIFFFKVYEEFIVAWFVIVWSTGQARNFSCAVSARGVAVGQEHCVTMTVSLAIKQRSSCHGFSLTGQLHARTLNALPQVDGLYCVTSIRCCIPLLDWTVTSQSYFRPSQTQS